MGVEALMRGCDGEGWFYFLPIARTPLKSMSRAPVRMAIASPPKSQSSSVVFSMRTSYRFWRLYQLFFHNNETMLGKGAF